MLFGLSTTAAWAADAVQAPDDANQPQPSGSGPSSSAGNSGDEQSGWQYLNGKSASFTDSNGADQTANDDSSAGSDQSANSEEASGDYQSANSEDASYNDQTAESDDAVGTDQSAEAEDTSENGQALSLQDFRTPTKDKLVVILPEGWAGSLPDLLAGLKDNSDAAEILVLNQDGQDADVTSSLSDEEDEFSASK